LDNRTKDPPDLKVQDLLDHPGMLLSRFLRRKNPLLEKVVDLGSGDLQVENAPFPPTNHQPEAFLLFSVDKLSPAGNNLFGKDRTGN